MTTEISCPGENYYFSGWDLELYLLRSLPRLYAQISGYCLAKVWGTELYVTGFVITVPKNFLFLKIAVGGRSCNADLHNRGGILPCVAFQPQITLLRNIYKNT